MMTQPRWIRRAEVRERYNTSDSSITRWIKAGKFPRPKKFGANSIRWDREVLDDYDTDPEAWIAE